VSVVDIAEVETTFGDIYRDAFRRVLARIAERQLGEAFLDLPEQHEWKEAA